MITAAAVIACRAVRRRRSRESVAVNARNTGTFPNGSMITTSVTNACTANATFRSMARSMRSPFPVSDRPRRVTARREALVLGPGGLRSA